MLIYLGLRHEAMGEPVIAPSEPAPGARRPAQASV